MSLKDIWNDLINGESDINAEDINNVAHAVIDLEENSGNGGSVIDSYTKIESDEKYATKEEVGNINEALDAIIAIQDALIGGDA